MIRRLALASLVAVAFAVTAVSAQTPAPAGPAGATPENAAAFMGDWVLSMQGPNGAQTSELTIKADAGKVAAEISLNGTKSPIKDISKTGESLVLSYAFDYQGMAVPAVVTLTPSGEKIGATIDFAGGAYVLEGSAAKKKA